MCACACVCAIQLWRHTHTHTHTHTHSLTAPIALKAIAPPSLMSTMAGVPLEGWCLPSVCRSCRCAFVCVQICMCVCGLVYTFVCVRLCKRVRVCSCVSVRTLTRKYSAFLQAWYHSCVRASALVGVASHCSIFTSWVSHSRSASTTQSVHTQHACITTHA